jgi:hypothetical protein
MIDQPTLNLLARAVVRAEDALLAQPDTARTDAELRAKRQAQADYAQAKAAFENYRGDYAKPKEQNT